MGKKIMFLRVVLFFLAAFIFTVNVLADMPPDPGTGGPGTGDVPVGGGAPIGGGLIMMLILGSAYFIKKTFHKEKE